MRSAGLQPCGGEPDGYATTDSPGCTRIVRRDGALETTLETAVAGDRLFTAGTALARRIPALIAAGISKRFGFEAPVVTRTAAELAAIARNNPFLRDGPDPKALHVVFLADPPDRSRAALLDPDRSPPDRFVLRGGEIYLLCPNGVGQSRLTAQYFDSKLETTSTFRNWNTVLKMLELSRLPARSG